jgi:protease-4
VSIISQATKDESIKAVVIDVDSPGGAVGASQEIYRAIEKLREKKPVVVSMGNVAASGGYYISASANVIYANPGTITGSIGVIIQHVDVSEILNKFGVKVNTIKSGANKDILYPTKPLFPEQKALLEKTVMDVYDQFLDAIVRYRPIKKDVLKSYADGRVFSGNEAKALGLVDKIGNIQDAISEAKKLGKLEEDTPVIELKPKKPLLDELMNSKFGMGKAKSGIYYMMSF